MKRSIIFLVFLSGLFYTFPVQSQNLWKPADAAKMTLHNPPAHYLVYAVDESALSAQLSAVSDVPSEGQVFTLPLADGSYRDFRVWRSGLVPPELTAKYPGLATFSAEATDNPNVTAKIDFTLYGFHAIIFDGVNVSFVDPSSATPSGYYTTHYKKDEVRSAGKSAVCHTKGNSKNNEDKVVDIAKRAAFRTGNGYQLRTYRLALACNHFYASAVTGQLNPTIAQTLSKMVTTMNRVNGVYERELSVTMNFVANEDAIIYTDSLAGVNGDDPFNFLNDNPGGCIGTNQDVCNNRIGTTNYDIGHVFTTGAGGLSQVGVVCDAGLKAESVTGLDNPQGDGFDIDYVSHEMGHEFGANHPFNNGRDDNCGGGNINAPTAYEPGSGSTIMAYAGICSPDDLQPHSDPYFHAANLIEIQHYMTVLGDGCAVKTPTGNKLVALPAFTASFNIPFLTPFELTAPAAADSVGDTSITYCWEQWNLGDVGLRFKDTHQYGPIFRSFLPAKSPVRVFPNIYMVLADSLSNAGTNNAEGEKVPDVARFLTFRLSVRDIFQGNGCFLVPDDTIHLNAINTGTGFKVTSQGTTGIIYLGKTTQTVTWDVVGSNTGVINTPNVDIYMSGDGGYTWPYFIGTFQNSGSASVILPNPVSDTAVARIKVKGSGNVFFNVNKKNFLVIHNPDTTNSPGAHLYPVPAKGVVHLESGNPQDIVVFNAIGQKVWSGKLYGQLDISVDAWARGVYMMRLIDDKNRRTIKKFVLD